MTAAKTTMVELVGGPRDGAVMEWPSGARTMNVIWQYGRVHYTYCGQGADGKLRAQVVREEDA